MDSPHARGWTRPEASEAVFDVGFPARAGMDRRRRSPTGSGSRDSPHARGWTAGVLTFLFVRNGFPARAGMDPAGGVGGGLRRRIPRTRGDGPPRPTVVLGTSTDSPHARGWTRHEHARRHGPAGFPARAGMDPASTRRGRPVMRIPRTRGDGPASIRPDGQCATDSPHARGWTPAAPTATPCTTGFPARAGMAPPAPARRAAQPGFPARAGMDRPRPPRWRLPRWIPRTRGDGPRTSSPAGRSS